MSKPSPLPLFGLGLLRAARLWRQETSRHLRAHYGLSEATVLPMIALYRLGEGLTQAALAEYMGISAPSLVRLIDTLVAQDWLERRESEADRRVKMLYFTKKGRRRIHAMDQDLMRMRKRLAVHVSEEELQTCLAVFEKIERSCAEAAETKPT